MRFDFYELIVFYCFVFIDCCVLEKSIIFVFYFFKVFVSIVYYGRRVYFWYLSLYFGKVFNICVFEEKYDFIVFYGVVFNFGLRCKICDWFNGSIDFFDC